MPRDRSDERRSDRYGRDERGRDRDQRRRSRTRSRSHSPVYKRRRVSRSASRSRRSRSRSKSRDASPRHRRRRSRSASSSSSVDRKRRKHKGKRSASEERERREKKERKKAKKEKKKSKAVAEWGKYGVITEADMFTKSQEFHTWLVEERKVNPETISKDQQRKEFARFMEDYNTATLPDRKYYDMESYNRRMNALRAGEFAPPPEDTYDPRADMKALSAAHKKRAAADDTTLSREKLMELRKVQNERVQAGKMRQLGMEVSQTMGVRMEDGASFDE